MTFTYDLAGSGDVSLVRFHIGDVEASAPVFSDEVITALLTINGQLIGPTVVACLKHKMALLSQPNFTADWLTVDNRSAREGVQALLVEKQKEFKLSGVTGRVVTVTRSDTPST